jgi:hypothetical protein
MSERTNSKSRKLFSIVARLCDWSLMLFGPLIAKYVHAPFLIHA